MSIGDWTKEDSSLSTRKRSQTFDLINTAFTGSSTGSANAYVLAFPLDFPNLARLLNGETFRWIPNFSNTGAATLTVPGITATSIKRYNGLTALSADDIISGSPVETAYDTVNSVFRLTRPSIGGNLQVTTLDATTVNATTVNATSLDADNGNIDTLTSATADITTLNATTITKAWTAWSPTVTYTGGGSMASLTTSYKYRVIGNKIEFLVHFDGTVTTTVTAINLTLPGGVTVLSNNYYTPIEMRWGGGRADGLAVVNNSGIVLREKASSSFPSGGGTGIQRSFFSAEI